MSDPRVERLWQILNRQTHTIDSPARHLRVEGGVGIATLEGPGWTVMPAAVFEEARVLLASLGEEPTGPWIVTNYGGTEWRVQNKAGLPDDWRSLGPYCGVFTEREALAVRDALNALEQGG
jgi:hypothetical protein